MQSRTILALVLLFVSVAQGLASDIAPTGTLRAAYLANNPAQAVRDPATGEIRGASADLARELGRRINTPVTLIPSTSPQAVIDAVSKGDADIGFVAYAPSRAGTVAFSQTYMLVRQSFLVPENSPIHSVADIDQLGRRISGGKGDSITLFLARTLKQAKLIETDNTPADTKQKFANDEIDAFGANRQRLTNMAAEMPGYRLLPDNIFDVPQTIIVPKDKPEVLAEINRFIDGVRGSGFLAAAIERSHIPALRSRQQATATARPSDAGSEPGALTLRLLLERVDLALLLEGEADIIETVEQAVLAMLVDLERHHAAVGPADFLLGKIDAQRRISAALGIVEQLVEILARDLDGKNAVLEAVVVENVAERRRNHRADAEIEQCPRRMLT